MYTLKVLSCIYMIKSLATSMYKTCCSAWHTAHDMLPTLDYYMGPGLLEYYVCISGNRLSTKLRELENKGKERKKERKNIEI